MERREGVCDRSSVNRPVELVNLGSRPELNGKRGTVLGGAESEARVRQKVDPRCQEVGGLDRLCRRQYARVLRVRRPHVLSRKAPL